MDNGSYSEVTPRLWCLAACLRGIIMSPSAKDLACWHLSLPCLLASCKLDFHWTLFPSPFNTDLREKRTDKWIYYPCQLNGYRNSHCMVRALYGSAWSWWAKKSLAFQEVRRSSGNSHLIFYSKNKSCKIQCWVACREIRSPWGPSLCWWWNRAVLFGLYCSVMLEHAVLWGGQPSGTVPWHWVALLV